MKVIFWDVDGVLNNPGTYGAWRDLGQPHALEREIVARAAALVKETGAKCVLSSSWRALDLGPTIETTLVALEQTGWPTCREDFIGWTPILGTARAGEIAFWLETANEPVERFVIVDDETDMLHLSPRHWWVNGAVGLTEKDCDGIKEMLQ